MAPINLTRRQFVVGSLATSLLVGRSSQAYSHEASSGGKYQLFWGDLHNHNEVGYGKGSLQRSIEIARAHLDFFTFTGHAFWHDMPIMEGDKHMKWVIGCKAHTDHWPKTRQMIREANSDDFVAFLGYEWHSSQFGDYCMIFPGDEPELFLPDHVNKLLGFAESKNALAIPHHVAYKQGWRGANFNYFRPSVSPIVEVYSEHGNSMSTDGPFPYIRHSMCGRSTYNTILRQLQKGLRFGFVASTDTHRGYPGAYGEGLAAVWARDLSRESLFEAFRARRTYAVTGDRILLDASLNGSPMGSQLPAETDRQLDVRVEGQDSIQVVELIRNGRIIDRYFPEDHHKASFQLPGRVKCRLQYGWGPWAALAFDRKCIWDMQIRIKGGRFLQDIPCWQSGPYDEDLRDKLEVNGPHEIHLHSFTSREKCYAQDPTKALVMEMEGGPDTELIVKINKPVEQTVKTTLGALIEDNVVTGTGGFFGESYIIHRLIEPTQYSADIRFHDRRPKQGSADWYFVRVVQHNGHLAWSSPIWLG